MTRPARIVLVDMPFGSIFRPPLGVGLITAQLEAAGLPCRALFLNFVLARAMGFSAYETIAGFKGFQTQIGEWLFAEACWRRDFGPDEDELLERCRSELDALPDIADRVAYLRRVRHEVVPAFLEESYRRIVAGGAPAVVGFSCMFFQTVAALALGRLLRERHPDIRLVYGGACFHGEMGEELFRATPWIDAVSTGEADAVIVPLFEALVRRDTPRDLESILARDRDGRVVAGPPPRPITAAELDRLPDPDFDGFFAAAREAGVYDDPGWQERSIVHYEASRGCWWGQKKHCTFCGLNGAGMAFRERSPERVLATLRNLAARYRVHTLHATDNILAMSYFRTLLPRLTEQPVVSDGRPVTLFFEVKANLTRAQVQQLRAAGVSRIQPGIESLATGLLERFDKGVTALQNVFLLKCCAEHDVTPLWNFLIRAPGETRADYEQMERWIPLLVHLRPPSSAVIPVECHRFSPYFSRREQYVEDVRPAGWYRSLFPEDRFDLAKVAYYFEVSWKDTLGDPAYDRVTELVAGWRARWLAAGDPPRLVLVETSAEQVELVDTRSGALVRWRLSAVASAIYRELADPISPRQIAARTGLPEPAVRAELDDLVLQGLVLVEGERFLGLALAPGAPVLDATIRRKDVGFLNDARTPPHRLPVIT
jgi:ribosomal peptide maturation radical SAM protein 1